MASQADPFEDPVKQKKYLKIAFFGKGGSGKTRAALSFPKPVIIDGEKGSQPYIGKYDFKVKSANRWKQLDPLLSWLRTHPGVYETLIIDPATIFYMDLIQEIVDFIKNKRGNETMTRGDWGVEKRRWAALLNNLTELPMHVILNFREKDEYEETQNRAGEEILKKTGNFYLDADKQTEYLFDLSFRCHTEENKKNKEQPTKFLMTCTKTRYDWMPKYGTYDVTRKRVFDELFRANVEPMLDAPDGPIGAPEPILIVPDSVTPPAEPQGKVVGSVDVRPDPEPTKFDTIATAPGAPDDPPMSVPIPTPEENIKQIVETFGVQKPSPDQPEASLEDIKVMMTRAGDMVWPDDKAKCRKQNCGDKAHKHEKFKSTDAKSMVKSLYGVESSKELRKPQIDFLYEEFGKVLSGRAFLDRDGQGTVYIATPMGVTEEEVRKNVLAYVK